MVASPASASRRPRRRRPSSSFSSSSCRSPPPGRRPCPCPWTSSLLLALPSSSTFRSSALRRRLRHLVLEHDLLLLFLLQGGIKIHLSLRGVKRGRRGQGRLGAAAAAVVSAAATARAGTRAEKPSAPPHRAGRVDRDRGAGGDDAGAPGYSNSPRRHSSRRLSRVRCGNVRASEVARVHCECA